MPLALLETYVMKYERPELNTAAAHADSIRLVIAGIAGHVGSRSMASVPRSPRYVRLCPIFDQVQRGLPIGPFRLAPRADIPPAPVL
jgi:hypothetical protein